MDPLTATIVVILGKYALDKGVELGKEVGPKALDTAKEMFTVTLDRLRKRSHGEVIAEEFKEDPETYQRPMEKVLDQAISADTEFRARLKSLLTQYEESARAHAEATGRRYDTVVKGSGAIAQDSSVAAGARGIAIGRDAHGDVSTSDRIGEKTDKS